MAANDSDLLGQYLAHDSEKAFAELVQRHLNLVYSAALRQVRSPQLAEEVAQSVFLDLARGASQLKPNTILTAWLYQVTRRTAIDVVRRESRRQARERLAVEMAPMNTAADWTHIEPFLDEAMAALDETDRAAILLRFFENKSLREVGVTLGTSDDAAQKRVSRAVEHLREFFTKRGVTIAAGGLVIVISANAVQAAPAGLAVTISSAAVLAGKTFVTATTATVTKAIAMTTLQKTAIIITLAAASGAGIYEARQASNLRSQVQTLQQQQDQQASSVAQIQQLTRERDEATNRLAGLSDEIVKMKNDNLELPGLRGEITRLTRDLSQLKGNLTVLGASYQRLENLSADSAASIRTNQFPRTNSFARAELRNVGVHTLDDAIQTTLYALSGSNGEIVSNSISPDSHLFQGGGLQLFEDCQKQLTGVSKFRVSSESDYLDGHAVLNCELQYNAGDTGDKPTSLMLSLRPANGHWCLDGVSPLKFKLFNSLK